MIYYTKNNEKAQKFQRGGYGAFAGSSLYDEALRKKEESRLEAEAALPKNRYPSLHTLTQEERALLTHSGPMGRAARIKASRPVPVGDPFADWQASQGPVTLAPVEKRGNYHGMPNLYDTDPDALIPTDEEIEVIEEVKKTRDPGNYGFRPTPRRPYTSPQDRVVLRREEEAKIIAEAEEAAKQVEEDRQINKNSSDASVVTQNKSGAKPNGAKNTNPEVVVESKAGSSAKEGGAKGGDSEVIDTTGFETHGLGDIAAKIIGNKKYDRKLKQEMLDVAAWQTRHKKTGASGHYLGAIDGTWGEGTQDAYVALQEEKKAKSPAVGISVPEVSTTPIITTESTSTESTPTVIQFQDNFDDEERWTNRDARINKKIQRNLDRQARQSMARGPERTADRRADRDRRNEIFREFKSFTRGGILYPRFQRGGRVETGASGYSEIPGYPPVPEGAADLIGGIDRGFDLPIDTPEIEQKRKVEAIKSLQKRLGIAPDGIWGPQSQQAYDMYLNQGTRGNSGIGTLANDIGIVPTPAPTPPSPQSYPIDRGFDLPIDEPGAQAKKRLDTRG